MGNCGITSSRPRQSALERILSSSAGFGGGARRSAVSKRVNVFVCKFCIYVYSGGVAMGKKRERVVNAPIYCGRGLVYMSANKSFCLHVV